MSPTSVIWGFSDIVTGATCEAKNQSVEKKGYPIRLTEFGQQDPEIFGRKGWNRGAA